ncbi:SH3 domain-containing protein [bacterium SCSIO 12643]|nr:SH3 domain-containing protein [bacterium SCSIO 12643]
MKVHYLLIILISLHLNVNAQEFYSVAAEHGLIIRQKADMTSPRIGKFLCGQDLKLIQKTDISVEVQDQNGTIKGHWYLMSSPSGYQGYLFSGYLLPKLESWQNGVTCEDEYIPCSTKLSTPNCALEIFNFEIEGQDHKPDTFALYEAVFNEVGDKLLKVKPRKEFQNIEVYYTRVETLNAWETAKDSNGIIPKWKGHDPFVKLEPFNQFFYRIPPTDYDNVREKRAQIMHLKRSPDWEESGEGGWFPRYIYKGQIVPYEIQSIILKIVTTDLDKNTSTEYIEIGLSYGC